jgi:hypothetical protein
MEICRSGGPGRERTGSTPKLARNWRNTVSLASWFRNLLSASSRPKGPQAPIGRNDLCWCGSGKKYKRCHLKKDELKRVEAAYSAQLTARNLMASGVVPGSGKKKPARQPEAEPTPADRG